MELMEEPEWLAILRQDVLIETRDSQILGDTTLGVVGRSAIWSLCKEFRYNSLRAMSQTVRIYERLFAGALWHGLYDDIDIALDSMKSQVLLILSCCFMLAVKSLQSAAPIRPSHIQKYLNSLGWQVTVQDVILTERNIFEIIDCHVPIYSSPEMAELLAVKVVLLPSALPELRQILRLAEFRRKELEFEVRWVSAYHRVHYGHPRVRTAHLAAGCVGLVVARSAPTEYRQAVERLARLFRVSCLYLEILTQVINIWTGTVIPKPIWLRDRQPTVSKRLRRAQYHAS
ncbi:uncharacterized protein LOC123880372 [Maniola jurtina]|uniref:uncharacterized protein LOC123880372 n=1 Tax=Maniola jurtina TaxID=191418 RepID=UPI001E689DA0|nr:uncharacterized protein LOC123880372 [Maniola jurtina]